MPFNIGDRVKVVRKVLDRSDDWDNCWTDAMDKYVNDGNVYTISEIDSKGIRFVERPTFGWPPASLELEYVYGSPVSSVAYTTTQKKWPFPTGSVGTISEQGSETAEQRIIRIRLETRRAIRGR